jgi:methyl-accepting chemotaxis protein
MYATMKTGTKILASYAVAIALLAGLGIVSYLSLEQVIGTTTLIAGARDPSASAVAKINEVGAQAETVVVAVVLAAALTLIVLGVFLSRVIGKAIRDATAEAARLTAAVAEGKLDVRGDAERVHFEFRPIIDGMNGTMDAFAKPLAQSRDYMERISRGDVPAPIADVYKGDFDRTKLALNRCIEAFKALVADGRSLADGTAAGKLSVRADASRHQGDFRRIIEGFNTTLDTVLAPVEESRRTLELLARRDLTARVKGDYQGDHAKLKDAVNATAEALHSAMAQVADAVEQVSAASAQIARSSQAVASGASEQASSLEETNSSLEAITAETRQAAVNASEASDLTGVARSSAQEGAAAMGQMQGTMGKIRQSAEGTSGIIKDISEIAFQTNLLALNAAVEAARAGEAGRGFAVVAEEVRSLALRAKEAAAKTEELIKESVKQAGEGEAASKHVAEKLGEIVEGVSEVSDITTAIAFTAKEQAGRIEQVNKAVGEMGKVTQQNAASSEESSSAAEELSSQSEELAAMVGSFKMERAGGVRRAAAPGRKAPHAHAKPKHANGKNGRHALLTNPEDAIPLEGETFKEF